ncbi:hypothetical protein GQ43DRAFT_260998 [Delitschia confertaspora ATCC 74209]|uniref:BTB domain-containing protein n=1 Tax=Delitschia confertaspora ATCC 74209 TaxID=1513339 RepID=A0A9P4JBB1_9PLEO|nr:hypothetical protein GQ43DRAFT_260998 [Delitschia confertaspora ATCC 74209]
MAFQFQLLQFLPFILLFGCQNLHSFSYSQFSPIFNTYPSRYASHDVFPLLTALLTTNPRLLTRSLVDIYVGPDNTCWTLHEKLLCYHSPFFRKIFYNKQTPTSTFGLPEEDDVAFKNFVGWLYSSTLPIPRSENDLTPLFDLYLMAEKYQIPTLAQEVLHTVREWYKYSDTYPGLRRVQYIYANTEEGSPMRHMLVHAVARQMVLLDDGIPKHWDKALRKNGQLAVDIIRAIHDWGLEEEVVPDAREEPADGENEVDEDKTVVESPGKEKQQNELTQQDGKKRGKKLPIHECIKCIEECMDGPHHWHQFD